MTAEGNVSGYVTEINGKKHAAYFGEPSDDFPPRIAKLWKQVTPEEFIAKFGDPTNDVPDYPPEIAALAKAAEPLREYLLQRGDPHSCVVVTQYGATLKRDEIGVPFAKAKCMSDDDFMREVSRNATEDLL